SLFTYQNVYRAYQDCRRKKRGKPSALAFELNAEENLLELTHELQTRTYAPSASFCFISKNDKYREVFAADFRDRVVHHLLVRYLEKIWEPIFIYDSYACRKGKGTHAAVSRLRSFLRKVTANTTQRAYFAQLDIRAFFPSIDRNKLLDLVLSKVTNDEIRWLTETLILYEPTHNPTFTCSPTKWRNVPPHKSLFYVPEGKGLPIGNLTSQFFANIYLNPLDQFIKHTIKCPYYLRYVDDLVLLHQNREQLELWIKSIDCFLKEHLAIELNPNRSFIRPVSNGIDFLGYIVKPTHLLVRRRIVDNCQNAIRTYTQSMLHRNKEGIFLRLHQADYSKLTASLNSYFGIFLHACCYRLKKSLFNKFVLLPLLFRQQQNRVIKKWVVPFHPVNIYTQYNFFRRQFRGLVLLQRGWFYEMYNRDAIWAMKHLNLKPLNPKYRFYARCGFPQNRINSFVSKLNNICYLIITQTGKITSRLAERIVGIIHIPANRKNEI
ncbi:MAG: reverse transcriptase domain-containing protein, partial [bacterium]|nr:reverse transcriptase domain-containing protein [bacterium]